MFTNWTILTMGGSNYLVKSRKQNSASYRLGFHLFCVIDPFGSRYRGGKEAYLAVLTPGRV